MSNSYLKLKCAQAQQEKLRYVSEAQPARTENPAPHRTDNDRRPTNHSGAWPYRLTNMAMTKAAADEQIPAPSIDEL